MKYEVGDKVLIKDIDWYNKNKDENDEVIFSSLGPVFTHSHSKYAGRIMTIGIISKLGFYILEEDKDGNRWYDEMFDTFAEEEVERLTGNLLNSWVNEFELPDGYIFKDENGNIINATKIVLEKKKKEYPKTYEECCTMLRFHYNHYLTYDDEKNINPTKEEEEFIDLMDAFSRLIVCRNAYWKIAGYWEPDYDSLKTKYTIVVVENKVVKLHTLSQNRILIFPTEEMRDAFYENFKELIESVKELL